MLVAVPGKLTTAYLALQLFAPGIETEVVPFDQIIPQILEGRYDAGLIIHEGQLTYAKSGLCRIVDFGKWWQELTRLPLPLGGNAIKRELGADLMHEVSMALKESIQYALDHRDEALEDPGQFGMGGNMRLDEHRLVFLDPARQVDGRKAQRVLP